MPGAILLFDGVTALDAGGPNEALWRVDGFSVSCVASDTAGLGRYAGRARR
ncbi:MAG: hypothetical protein M3069_33065 [Chloroflexota bacterium]|nr:hypothetical protein [Chloroflexota bacterium]